MATRYSEICVLKSLIIGVDTQYCIEYQRTDPPIANSKKPKKFLLFFKFFVEQASIS